MEKQPKKPEENYFQTPNAFKHEAGVKAFLGMQGL